MNLTELKQKAEELKKRSDAVSQVITKAEAQKEMLHKRLNDDFGIKPEEIDSNLEKMQSTINEKKSGIEAALIKFEAKLAEVENIIND